MFGAYNVQTATVFLDWDPASDDDIPVFVAPKALEITGAKFTLVNALAGSTANYFDLALYNGGTAGTALTAVSGTAGGTAGYSAMVPNDFTVTNGTMAANEVLKVRYNEEGTGTFTAMILSLNYVLGKA